MPRNRKALQHLKEWSERTDRKPLIIRGARQVGKSTLVRMIAEQYAHYIELNVEKPAVRALFERYASVSDLYQAILLRENISTKDGTVLLFIDEIQEAPEAIRLLRYFYEELPDVHVIAAGSLLDFALGEVSSFPVGRVTYYYLFPLDFEEFLWWLEEDRALGALQQVPLPGFAYQRLFELYHAYAMIGGMPEIVAAFARRREVTSLTSLYNDLWQAYLNDVEKYGKNQSQKRILRHLIRTAPFAQDRVKFANFGQSNYNSREVGEAMRTLHLARIIQLIYPITQTALPIISDLKKRPRLQLLDTGLLNHALGIQSELIAIDDLHDLYRGRVIQHVITQELYCQFPFREYSPHFWVRENANANAEVNLIYLYRQKVVPIEIKAGPQGRLRSLHEFINRAPHPYAVRFLKNEISVESYQTKSGKAYHLMNLPYFLTGKLPEYLAYFMDTHSEA